MWNENLAKLILRLSIGGMMLLHGMGKISTGVGQIGGLLQSQGIPSFLAYGVFIGEVVAPLFLILGLMTRLSALMVMATMLVAIFTAHAQDIYAFNATGGWAIELQALYFFGSLVIFLQGSGNYAARPTNGVLS